MFPARSHYRTTNSRSSRYPTHRGLLDHRSDESVRLSASRCSTAHRGKRAVAEVACTKQRSRQRLAIQRLLLVRVSVSFSYEQSLTCSSDTAATLLNVPHALNGSFTRQTPNSGARCTALCRSQTYKYAGTDNDQCCTSPSEKEKVEQTSPILTTPQGAATSSTPATRPPPVSCLHSATRPVRRCVQARLRTKPAALPTCSSPSTSTP